VTRSVSATRLAAALLVPVTAGLAIVVAMAWVPSVFSGSWVMPSGHDGVYHARRILDALDAPWRVMQFDPRIHAPEGSWVPWPWGFDALLAALARLLQLAGVPALTGLVFLPPAFAVLNAALVVAVARALRLPPPAQWLAGLCFALSPLTQMLHGLGQIDHHFLELSCVLAAMWLGLRWLDAPERAGLAGALGVVLGAANAVHNGLFLLQLPIVLALGLLWLRGTTVPSRSAAALAAGLLATTLAVALPADAFRAGMLRFDLLSWFHVYAGSLTALAALLMAGPPPDRARMARVALGLGVATAPLAREALTGLGFVSAGIYTDLFMPEMRGPFAGLLSPQGPDLGLTWRLYTGLIYLLPVGLAGAAVAVLSRRTLPATVYFCVASLAGGLLLTQQYRFHQYGSFALYLLPLLYLVRRFPQPAAQRAALLGFAVVCACAYARSLPTILLRSPPFGGSPAFALTRALYGPLAEACAARPGVVLADNNDGHYIRLLTECSVIGNNLVLSQQSLDKVREANGLLALPAAELPGRAPWVRYVLVRRKDDILVKSTPAEVLRANAGLRRELLLQGPPWPARWRLLGEIPLLADGEPLVLARVFEVAP
jgi:hypothetical protein